MNAKLTLSLAAVALLVSPLAAFAEAASQITITQTLKVDHITVVNGVKTHTVSTDAHAAIGDEEIITESYHWAGTRPSPAGDILLPLSPSQAFVSASPEGYDVSVDGGKSWGALATLKVTGADGARRAAEAGDVTHVRWRFASFAPGASGSASVHVTVR